MEKEAYHTPNRMTDCLSESSTDEDDVCDAKDESTAGPV
jgi:hypothetical protein